MQVKNILPEHFAELYPKFISLLEKYYEWQDTNNSTELLSHLFAARDINETDITLLSYIEDELLLGEAYFEGFGDTDSKKRAAANFSNVLFRSKGTKFAIEWFFRSFYQLDAEVLYPKENIFKLNESSSLLGPDSLRYLTDDKLYQTYALLVRVGIPVSKWRDVFKLFAHPAGMYLGGEVILTDEVLTDLIADQQYQQVTKKNKQSYDLTVVPITSPEGTTFDFTVAAYTPSDQFDAAYYYIENVTTSPDDFKSTFYDSTAPNYVPMERFLSFNRGLFSIETRLDSDETETAEQFNVYIKDKQGNVADFVTVDVSNAFTQYSLAVDSASPYEGETINFTITGVPTNPPNDQLEYYISPIGTNPVTAADFTGTIPLPTSRQSINVVDDSARFSLTASLDGLTEPSETFRVVVAKGSIVKAVSPIITILNNDPDFAVSLNNANVFEGQSLVANIIVDKYDVGSTVRWEIEGDAANDSRFIEKSGTFQTSALSNGLVIPISTDDVVNNGGTVSGNLVVSNLKYGISNEVSASVGFTVADSAPSYSIAPTTAAGTPGTTTTFNVEGRNIPDNTNVYMYIDYNQTDASDYSTVVPLDGSRVQLTVTNNLAAGVPIAFELDNEQISEVITVNLSSSNTPGAPADLATLDFTILGTDVSYSLSASQTTVDEGQSITFEMTGTGFEDGIYYYWIEGTNVTQGDFASGYGSFDTRKTFTVSALRGEFTVVLANDFTFEGEETFKVKVSRGSAGSSLVQSPTITVNDTSQSGYTITVDNIVEGGELIVEVDPTSSGSERIYLEVTGDAINKLPTVQQSVVSSSNAPFNVSLGTTTESPAYENNSPGVVTLSRNNYASLGGTQLTSTTFNINDAAPTFSMFVDGGDTVAEGDPVTFLISGTNIPSATYYYSISNDIVSREVNILSSAGTSIIFLSDTTGLQIGMRSSGLGVNGTITNVAGQSVTMSQALSFDIIPGNVLHFAFPAVFEDFSNSPTGTVSITNNLGQFTVNTAVNGDVQNDNYTFVLLDQPTSATPLVSQAITIVEQTSNGIVEILVPQLDVPIVTPVVDDYSTNTEAFAKIRFNPNGKIQAIGSESPGSSLYVDVGTWTTGSFNPSDYYVFASVTSETSGAEKLGSYNTPLQLSTSREFGVRVPFPAIEGITRRSTVNVTFAVYSTISNIDSQQIELIAEARNGIAPPELE